MFGGWRVGLYSLVSALLPLALLSGVMGCNFPDFLQSYGGAGAAVARRDWRTHWRHQQHDDTSTSSTSAEVLFDGGFMRSEEPAPPRRRQMEFSGSNVTLYRRRRHHDHANHRLTPFMRQCRQVVDSDDGQTRYLTSHRRLGQSRTRFICVEFVMRSPDVVQVSLVASNQCSTIRGPILRFSKFKKMLFILFCNDMSQTLSESTDGLKSMHLLKQARAIAL